MTSDTTIHADGINDDALVLRDDQAGIATLTLNRSSKFNALSSNLMAELERVLSQIADDTSIRVVVLAAHGKAFCAGHDLKELGAKETREEVDALFRQCSGLMLAITGLPQPVVAKVDGIATAAGCQLVATCDLAVASASSRFATSGINVGLFCATPGVALSRNVPRKKAMEMLLTGDFIDSTTALQFGLINQVVEPEDLDAAVQAFAEKITRHSPKAISMGKSLFYRQISEGLESAYGTAVDSIVDNMIEGDARAGIEAFIAKQPMPDWEDR
jgi:enoyl-CoA hydratase/carnithine racemase